MVFRFLLCAVFTLILPISLQAADDCELAIEDKIDKAYGYRDRGGFCEGVYKKKYSSASVINLVGYHLAPFRFFPKTTSNVELIAVGPKNQKLHSVILDTVPNTFYRRDQMLNSNEAVDWSLRVLANQKLSLRGNQLVGVACLPRCLEATDAYYPLSVSGNSQQELDPTLYFELPKNTHRVSLSLVDPSTKKPIVDPNTNKPLLEYIREFSSRKVRSIERFSLPALTNYAYLELDVILENDDGVVMSKVFLLGGVYYDEH